MLKNKTVAKGYALIFCLRLAKNKSTYSYEILISKSYKSLTINEGTYVFEIANKDVDHNVGFVLAPKGKTDEANHTKTAYVKSPVATGSTSLTNEVTPTKGEYVYFCPLNTTPQYGLVVK